MDSYEKPMALYQGRCAEAGCELRRGQKLPIRPFEGTKFMAITCPYCSKSPFLSSSPGAVRSRR